MTPIRKKLIEVALPLEAINVASAREKSIRHGHPSTLHLWWARRPLAACRAVLFSQLVDDPSAWPDHYPTDAAQETERQRLFGLITDLVQWENSNSDKVIHAARLEIARSMARGRKANGEADHRDDAVLRIPPFCTGEGHYLAQAPDKSDAATVNSYLAEVAPPVHDPFAGGGSIPLEAQRLGLRAIATDLNPVAVLINKALIEIPPKFAGMPPVNPESRKSAGMRTWKGAQGLAEDVRYYGKWMRDEAFKRIGHLYPPVKITEEMCEDRPDLKPYKNKELTVIAWLWARTVASPNPACNGVHVPLVSSFWLSKKPGKEAWIEPVVDRETNTWRFEVRVGKPKDTAAVDAGTKTGRGTFQCILSGEPMAPGHIQAEGKAGQMKDRLMAVVAEGQRTRLYLPPTQEHEATARVPLPDWTPDFEFAKNSRHMTPWVYGLDTFAKLFTPRQLTIMNIFSELIGATRERVLVDACAAGLGAGVGLGEVGGAAKAYGEAISVTAGCCISRLADFSASLCVWSPAPKNEVIMHVFGRQGLTMNADFAESNPFSESSGNWLGAVEWVALALQNLPANPIGRAFQMDAALPVDIPQRIISTDPPYYDNVPYADLSDFFYVWLRRSLHQILPSLFTTMLVPKAPELIAEPFRQGGKEAAEVFFLDGMTEAIRQMYFAQPQEFPAAIYYAFKQAEGTEEVTSSTGWETFLQAVMVAGFLVGGTWPVRTERPGRLRDTGSNALASSIVLVCRKRPDDAPTTDRTEFRRLLRQELPEALRLLQKGNIAPVDMAQASIGPGMAIFSRHSRVLESDGTPMSVRTALQLINQALDEYLTEQEGEFDGDTRFAITWFETRMFDAGAFGEAETLAKARNVSVAGVVEAGFLQSGVGKVRLLRREELPDDWDPTKDKRPTVWEATQHLIKRLETKGEQGAAELLVALGGRAAPARDLAYRLYTTCERKKWAEEARAYNGLVIAWPELEKLALQVGVKKEKTGRLL